MGDGQPLVGVHVVLEDGQQSTGTITNRDGYYLIPRVKPGRYRAQFSFVGYATVSDSLSFDFNEQHQLNVSLAVDPEALKEVVVESERPEHDHARSAGFVSVRPGDIQKIPLPGLSNDLANFLTAVPGIRSTGEQGGRLYVRGGTPTQNLFLIDGIPIYQPLHIVGFYSAFPDEIVSNANIYAGGYGARYGGRLSSVVDVSSKNGSKRRLVGSASIAPLLGTARIELPLLRDRISVVASVRESLVERVFPEALRDDLPYRFGDRFVKLHAFLSKTSHVAITGLSTNDRGNVAAESGLASDIQWQNRAVGARYFYLAQAFPVLTELVLSISNFEMTSGPVGMPDQISRVNGFTGAINFGYLLGSWEAHFGLFAHSTSYRYNLDAQRAIDEQEFIGEGGVYLDLRFFLPKGFMVEPGMRVHSFASRGQMFVEPRIRATWQPVSDLLWQSKFSLAAGLYHQQTVGITSDRIVTDVFTAWAPSPKFEAVPRAVHVIAGWSARPARGITASVEAYTKFFEHLAFPDFAETVRPDSRFLQVEGYSNGLDAQLEVRRRDWFGVAGYGLSGVLYEAEGQRFHPPHDRRHHVSASFGTTLKNVKVQARWQYGSGLPFTQLAGFYDRVPIDTGSRVHHTAAGTPSIVFAKAYGGRLPAYHRMDLSIERSFDMKWAEATFQVGAVNVYDRSNLFDLDLFSERRVNQLPLIPTIGMRVEVR